MEQNNYLDIIEGMLYLAGDDGVDIKQVAGVLEISKKEATLLMDQFTEIYGNKALKGIVLVNFGGLMLITLFIIKRWSNKAVLVYRMLL